MRRVAALLTGALLVAGCGGTPSGASRPAPTPSGFTPASVSPPPGVSLTPAGTTLGFGQPAVVGFAPTAKRATTLQVTVVGARRGRVRDLAAYAQTATAIPFYVRVDATNLGPDDVAGAALPVWATTSSGAVVAATGFAQPYARCPSTVLPTPFAAAARLSTCLVYLLPQSETLVSLTNRAASGAAVVTWTGTVQPPRKRR